MGKKLSLLDFNMIYVYFELPVIRIFNGFACVTMKLFLCYPVVVLKPPGHIVETKSCTKALGMLK